MQNKFLTKNHIPVIALLFIVLVGASLRLYGLDIQSFWNDELSSWYRSSFESLSEVINIGVRPDVHPPGYQIFLYYVEQYIGDSEKILRLPSTIAGICSIVVIFLIGKQLYSYKEGLIAAALMAVLHTPIYYSQEARAYSLLVLFTLLATYFWIKILMSFYRGKEISIYVTLGYIVASIIASYLHYYGLFLIALQGVAALLFAPKNLRIFLKIAGIYAILFLAYIPWMPTMITQFSGRAGSYIQVPQYAAIIEYVRFLFNDSYSLVIIVLSLYSFLLVSKILGLRRQGTFELKSPRFSPGLFLALWLVVPFLIVFLISITARPILTNRNLLISMPAAYLLLAHAIIRLPIGRMSKGIVTLSLIGFLLYNLFFTQNYYSRPHKNQFRESVGYVVNESQLQQKPVVIGYAWHQEYLNYYFRKHGVDQIVDLVAGEDEDIALTREYIKEENPDYIWYIVVHKKPSSGFVAFLEQEFTLIDYVPFVGAKVWLFKNEAN